MSAEESELLAATDGAGATGACACCTGRVGVTAADDESEAELSLLLCARAVRVMTLGLAGAGVLTGAAVWVASLDAVLPDDGVASADGAAGVASAGGADGAAA